MIFIKFFSIVISEDKKNVIATISQNIDGTWVKITDMATKTDNWGGGGESYSEGLIL